MLLFAAAAHALDFSLMKPKVEFSAVMTIETGEGSVVTKVYRADQMEREEMEMSGMKSVSVIRFDKGITWNWEVMPFLPKEYDETRFNPTPDDSRPKEYSITEQTVVGKEIVNGLETTKTKVVISGKKGKYAGFMWTTDSGITVKTDVLSVGANKKERMRMELNDIKIGKIDRALFEVPPGYKKGSGLRGW